MKTNIQFIKTYHRNGLHCTEVHYKSGRTKTFEGAKLSELPLSVYEYIVRVETVIDTDDGNHIWKI